MSETINDANNEIEQLKARIAELEKMLNKPKREYQECECPECHKMLKNKFILKTHLQTVHNQERQKY